MKIKVNFKEPQVVRCNFLIVHTGAAAFNSVFDSRFSEKPMTNLLGGFIKDVPQRNFKYESRSDVGKEVGGLLL